MRWSLGARKNYELRKNYKIKDIMETEGDTVIRVISVCRHMEVEDNLFSKDRDRTDYLINGVKRK